MSWRFLTSAGSLGSGGFGEVYGCHRLDDANNVLDTAFAVKLCAIDEDDDDVDEMQLRFRNGGRLGKRLRHPNIVRVVQVGDRADGTPYIVMPLADGGNLDGWLTDTQPDETEKAAVFRQILEAMSYAHGQNILHRDIKAENVLFVKGVPQLADFDLAKDIDAATAVPTITSTNVGIGTLGYMAPEQFTDLKRVGPPADVYALGRLWWRMLSGKRPPEVSLDLQAVPAQWRALIDKACEYRQHERYGTAGEMLRAFDALVAAPPGSPMQEAQELAERWNADEPHKHCRTLKAIDEHFRRHSDDDGLHSELAPFLPPALLDQWMTEHPGGFNQMVIGVDQASAGGLLWDDCDGFARFYIRVFETSQDDALRCRAMEQVLRIGASHNRYPVANMLRAVLGRVEGDEDAEIVARAVRNQPNYAAWFHIQPDCHTTIVEAFENPSAGDV